jgi:hypothetical protein
MQAIEQLVRADGGGIDSLNKEELEGGLYFSTKKGPFYFGNVWLSHKRITTGQAITAH